MTSFYGRDRIMAFPMYDETSHVINRFLICSRCEEILTCCKHDEHLTCSK